MQLITLTKEFKEESFIKFMGEIFAHPEIISGSVKEIVITCERRKRAAGLMRQNNGSCAISKHDLLLCFVS